MATNSERINRLEIEQRALIEGVKIVNKEQISHRKKLEKLDESLDDVENIIAMWNGGISLMSKAVFLFAAITSIIIAISKYNP